MSLNENAPRDHGYIEVLASMDFVSELSNRLSDFNMELPKYRPHVTLMYDKNKDNIKEPLVDLNPGKEFIATIDKIELLGENKDAVVLTLSSIDLVNEHRRLTEAGHEHTFDEYLPHITVGYDLDKHQVAMCKLAFQDFIGKKVVLVNERFGWKKD